MKSRNLFPINKLVNTPQCAGMCAVQSKEGAAKVRGREKTEGKPEKRRSEGRREQRGSKRERSGNDGKQWNTGKRGESGPKPRAQRVGKKMADRISVLHTPLCFRKDITVQY